VRAMRHPLAALALVACGPSGQGPPDTSSACVEDTQCPAGQRCAEGICVGGCGGNALDLTYVPPNLLLVLDRSCSMRDVLTGAATKWSAAVGAINSVLAMYGDEIRWGLTLFPDTMGDTCTQQAFPFPVAASNAPGISTLLTNALAAADPLYPDGPCVTNIDTGLQQAATDPALDDAGRKSYLMLVTDGLQAGCSTGGGDTGSENTIKQLHNARGVTTFVVGFGSGVDATELSTLATLGGAPLSGATKYYQADTAAQLNQAFQQIADLVVSCDYKVDPPPPDPSQLYVWFQQNELVPPGSGWTYDPATQTLTLHGMYCDRLKAHSVDHVDVIFGCPNPPIL